jgi:hypothetical protein
MNMNPNSDSRLDKKHARDELVKTEGDQFWEELVVQLETAVKKMESYFGIVVEMKKIRNS